MYLKTAPTFRKDFMSEHPLLEKIANTIKSGNLSALEKPDFSPGRIQKTYLCFQMLVGSMREHVIKNIKAPLRKALITGKTFSQVMKTLSLVIKRLPEVTKGNTAFKKTHNIANIEDRFFQYEDNLGREDMFRAVIKLLKAEIEHDGFYYGVRYDWWLEQHIIMVLTGEWLTRLEGEPTTCWQEPEPYGGKHTIIDALQRNREKIIDLLGEEWKWMKTMNYEEGACRKLITTKS